jgi:hypothetical protein
MNDYEDMPECPNCAGNGNYLGTLGTLDWFNCRQCGAEFGIRFHMVCKEEGYE